ncbi:MAG: alpha/beta hydrolase, partial [Antricoccus sp.]
MAAPITYSTVVAAAGGDPHEIALPVLTANASEVEALGALFCSASDRTDDIEKWATDGYLTAITAAVIADATPMDLMTEVVESQKTLGLGNGSLSLIGASMYEIAARIPVVQQQLAENITAAHQVVELTFDAYEFAIAGQSDPLIIEQLGTQCWASAVAQMGPIVAQAEAIVQSYDEFLTDRLSLLRVNFDYLAPKSLSDGAGPARSAQMLHLIEQTPSPTTSPKVVSSWWASLSTADQVTLMSQSGSALALLHGLPATVYNALNRREVTDMLVSPKELTTAQKVAKIDTFMATNFPGLTPNEVLEGPKSAPLMAKFPTRVGQLQTLMREVAGTSSARVVQQSLANGSASKYLLEFHPDTKRNDGIDDSQVVIAVGDPDSADNLVVEVPGTSNSAQDSPALVATAKQTQLAMNSKDGGAANAVIAYMGYDAPDTLTAAVSPEYGKYAAAALSADLLGYDTANLAVDGK